MLIQFTLSMPGVNSWNGRWSGEGKPYAVVKNIQKAKGELILKHNSYAYDFGDGWRASVSVHKIDSKVAAKIRRKSAGFCGYEWMITSILKHQRIETTAA